MSETIQGRTKLLTSFLKENIKPKILYLTKTSFKNEDEIYFQIYKSWRNLSLAVGLPEILKGVTTSRRKMIANGITDL